MIIYLKQVKELEMYIENIDDFIAADDVQGLLDALDDVIVNNILGNSDEPYAEGIRLQKIYDEIMAQNRK